MPRGFSVCAAAPTVSEAASKATIVFFIILLSFFVDQSVSSQQRNAAAKVRKKRTRINRIGTNNIDNVPNSFPLCKEIRNFATEINS
jgi:hypothetical protein